MTKASDLKTDRAFQCFPQEILRHNNNVSRAETFRSLAALPHLKIRAKLQKGDQFTQNDRSSLGHCVTNFSFITYF